ncbi:LuxR family transcriptional regulator [Dietzia sp. UCD-THP]|uniref:MadR family response regulator transcription factor n=1 Tax=Dietzia sp. UCD-THP TaxID=1292020 RepID=UPI000371DBA4|nr:response regulator transcription factor [Dietzia sp. UCD-THP]EYT61956.1 LuxR family transcriptional regulator [Dietzia sp. UCD-THP]
MPPPATGPATPPATGPTTPPGTIRTVLVDDHAVLREGLRLMLEREPDLEVVGEASTADAALGVINSTRPDVAVIDLKLGSGSELDGLRLCAAVRDLFPEVAPLVLTTFLDKAIVVRAVRAGARGYVVKNVDVTELVTAVRSVSAGQSAFDARTASMVVDALRGVDSASEALSAREIEVLTLLAEGMSNKEIGQTLFISATTAKFHISNILRKLKVSRRAEAVYVASRQGLL